MIDTQVEYWKLQESGRHNLVTERQGEINARANERTSFANLQNAASNTRNASTNERNADINLMNAYTNQQNAYSNARQAGAAEVQAKAAWENAKTNRANYSLAADKEAWFRENTYQLEKDKFAFEQEKWYDQALNRIASAYADFASGDRDSAYLDQIEAETALKVAQSIESAYKANILKKDDRTYYFRLVMNSITQIAESYSDVSRGRYYSQRTWNLKHDKDAGSNSDGWLDALEREINDQYYSTTK